jgi:galactokinase/mevalonate kinase-like predicted kinase
MNSITELISRIPYRIALAGGWIDQPFVSRVNPTPPGSMVVISLEPVSLMMERAGMATGTRNVAIQQWGGVLPDRAPDELARELYDAENRGKAEPSGSQDMIGIIYPGVNRLDYDADWAGGVFPAHIESNCDPKVAAWIEDVLQVIPVAQRPEGYSPLGIMNLDSGWISRLGRTGADCFDALVAMDLRGLGASMNECMRCWEAILPHTVRHATIRIDLSGLLRYYQSRYAGAMYSGCGGGYLLVASREPVPGSFRIQVRLAPN